MHLKTTKTLSNTNPLKFIWTTLKSYKEIILHHFKLDKKYLISIVCSKVELLISLSKNKITGFLTNFKIAHQNSLRDRFF